MAWYFWTNTKCSKPRQTHCFDMGDWQSQNLTKQVCSGIRHAKRTVPQKQEIPSPENWEHTKNNTDSKWRVSLTGSLTCLETVCNVCITSESITVNYGQVHTHKHKNTVSASKTITTWLNSSATNVVCFLNNSQWITDKSIVIRLREKTCDYITWYVLIYSLLNDRLFTLFQQIWR